ncbi:glycosyltransferase family 2 protein [bacterium]|nr:glycosyltransferase family 2 protein [bacterium]
MKNKRMDISIVIPVYNEEANIEELFNRITLAMSKLHYSYEIIFVNDGSTDNTQTILESIYKKTKKTKQTLKIIQFTSNFRKAAAYSAGFENAEGEYIITMDGDLQDDPFEIEKFLLKAKEGFEFVTGHKVNEKGKSSKNFASRIFNLVISKTFKLEIHDIDCPFRLIRSDIAKDLHLYEGNYRFIPLLAKELGANIAEIPIKNLPRLWGKSKYSGKKLEEGFFDYLTQLFLLKYRKKPMHFFGAFGILFGLTGFLILLYLTIIGLMGKSHIGNRPLLSLGILLVITGIQLFSTGFLAESIIRQSNSERHYKIKKILRE